jgi:hypothetical protein
MKASTLATFELSMLDLWDMFNSEDYNDDEEDFKPQL